MPLKGRASFAHAGVEVHEKLDGTLAILYQEQYLSVRSDPPEATVSRKLDLTLSVPAIKKSLRVNMTKMVHKPASNHPWHRAVTGFNK